MNALTVSENNFDGIKLTTITYGGRPCWIAREVGQAIGYSGEGKEFVKQIQDEWADDMVEGHDFSILRGQELQQFKELAELGGKTVPSRAPHLILLFETGLWMALARTRRDAGKRLRRFLVDNVLPQIARDGQYSPDRQVTPEGQLVDREDGANRLALEERRIALAERELEQRQRELARSALLLLRDELPHIGQDIKAMLAVKAAEAAYGRPLTALLPPADESLLSWESPSQIGERLGVTSNRVGRVISILGLKGPEGKGIEGMSRVITNKATSSERTVPTYLYSPKAVAQIEQYLRDHGYVTSR